MDLPLSSFPERENINRLRHLYGEDINDDVLNFWRRILVSLCKHRNTFTLNFDAADIERIFTVKGISPMCLPKVFALLQHKDFVYLESLNRSGGYNFLLNTIISTLPGSVLSQSYRSFVCIPLLQEIESLVLKYVEKSDDLDRILFISNHQQPSLQYFIHKISDDINIEKDCDLKHMLFHFNSTNTNILINYMLSKGTIAIHEEQGIIKILNKPIGGYWIMNSNDIQTIPAIEISKRKLRSAKTSLNVLILEYEKKIESLQSELKDKIKNRFSRGVLLNRIRVRRSMESALEKLEEARLALDQTEQTMMVSELNISLADTYRACTLGLRSLRVDVASVEGAVEGFYDEAALVEEARALLTDGTQHTEYDEDELIAEFEGLSVLADKEDQESSTSTVPLLPELPLVVREDVKNDRGVGQESLERKNLMAATL